MEQAERPRRNYIRRKRCFNDCMNVIAKTLRIIKQAKGEPFSEAAIKQLAIAHASEIEAACWTPRSKMTDDEYQALTNAKSCELCCAILRESLKNIDQGRLKFVLLMFVQMMAQNGNPNVVLPKLIPTEPAIEKIIEKVPDPPQTIEIEPQKGFSYLLDNDLPGVHLPEPTVEPLDGYSGLASLDDMGSPVFLAEHPLAL